MKLTKSAIENMAYEIMEFLKTEKLSDGVSIYFNNKRMNKDGIEEGEFNPKEYFEYAADSHILSMSFEGRLNHVFNYYLSGSYCDEIIKNFIKILDKYGVWYELGNAWNLTCYPNDDELEVEYTYYQSKPEPIKIYDLTDQSLPKELIVIGMAWKELQNKIGDVGSCVIGAGFGFKYNNKEYFLTPCSRFQGSVSWETDKGSIEKMLQAIGATDIKYKWGVMD